MQNTLDITIQIDEVIIDGLTCDNETQARTFAKEVNRLFVKHVLKLQVKRAQAVCQQGRHPERLHIPQLRVCLPSHSPTAPKVALALFKGLKSHVEARQ